LSTNEELYYITSPHGPGPERLAITGNCVVWWAKAGQGYTCNLNEAWQVDAEKAASILRDKRGDRAYRVSEIDAIAARHLDFQLLRDVSQRVPSPSRALMGGAGGVA
jgi:hypothetical protein